MTDARGMKCLETRDGKASLVMVSLQLIDSFIGHPRLAYTLVLKDVSRYFCVFSATSRYLDDAVSRAFPCTPPRKNKGSAWKS